MKHSGFLEPALQRENLKKIFVENIYSNLRVQGYPYYLVNKVYSVVTNTATVSVNIESETVEEKNAPQVCNQTNSYLQKRETEVKQDSELLAAHRVRTRLTC